MSVPCTHTHVLLTYFFVSDLVLICIPLSFDPLSYSGPHRQGILGKYMIRSSSEGISCLLLANRCSRCIFMFLIHLEGLPSWIFIIYSVNVKKTRWPPQTVNICFCHIFGVNYARNTNKTLCSVLSGTWNPLRYFFKLKMPVIQDGRHNLKK